MSSTESFFSLSISNSIHSRPKLALTLGSASPNNGFPILIERCTSSQTCTRRSHHNMLQITKLPHLSDSNGRRRLWSHSVLISSLVHHWRQCALRDRHTTANSMTNTGFHDAVRVASSSPPDNSEGHGTPGDAGRSSLSHTQRILSVIECIGVVIKEIKRDKEIETQRQTTSLTSPSLFLVRASYWARQRCGHRQAP